VNPTSGNDAGDALPVVPSPRGGTVPGLGRVLVCIPTYDERETLPLTLRRLRAAVPEADVLVLDDASPDGTGEIADAIAARDGAVHGSHRAGKPGLGAAYVDGFAWGLARGYDVLVELDADGSHQPEDLPRLLTGLRDADVVLGSRWVPGGQVRNWPRFRMLLSRGGNLYTRVMLGLPLADATGGFRAYRADVLRALPLKDVSSRGYCFQVDLAKRAVDAGFTVVELPITFVEREIGYSKMSGTIVAEALLQVTRWGLQQRIGGLGGRSRPRTPALEHPAPRPPTAPEPAPSKTAGSGA